MVVLIRKSTFELFLL